MDVSGRAMDAARLRMVRLEPSQTRMYSTILKKVPQSRTGLFLKC
jgi:hypothetical protein